MKKKGIGNRLMAWLLLVIMTLQVTGVNSALPVYADELGFKTITTRGTDLKQVAVDDRGSVYVVEYRTGNVVKIEADGSIITTISTGASDLSGIAVDSSGNIYVSNMSTNSIIKMNANGGNQSTIATGFSSPRSIAVDKSGNVYVTDIGSNQIKKIEAGSGTVTTIASGFKVPLGIALDNAGNIYVVSKLDTTVKKMDANGNNITVLGSGFKYPEGVAVDSSGNIYVYDGSGSTIKKMDKDGNNISEILDLSSFKGSPKGITVDSADNVYFSYLDRQEQKSGVGKIPSSTPPANKVVDALSLNSLVAAPSTGAAPDTATIDQTQYTGTVAWYEADGTTPVHGNFAPSTVYKALVTLKAKSGYKFTGVAQNSFMYTGASNVTNSADSGMVMITFPATHAIGYTDGMVTPGTNNSFYPLCLTAKASRTSQKLSFKKVTGADGYEISSGICGKSRSKTAEVSSDTTTYTIRNLKKDTYYKFKVSAYKIVNGQKITIARSQLIHSTTLGTKHTNPAKVTVDVKNVTLKVKKSKQLICDTIAASDLKVNLHEAKIRYESSDRSIAKVSSKGKITAVGKGSCVVFAYAQNGIYQKINITVK